MISVVNVYKTNLWSHITGVNDIPVLPVNDPLMVSVMEILIQEKPNNDNIGELTEWMIDQKGFDLATFVKWIRVFKDKEARKSVGFSMHYPLREKLIEHLRKHCLENGNLWVRQLISDSKLNDVAIYLVKSGFKFEEFGIDTKDIPVPQRRSAPPENKIREKPKQNVTSTTRRRRPLIRRNTVGKKKALEAYKKNPSTCSKFLINSIFQDFEHIEQSEGELNSNPTSVVGLMKYVSDLERADLTNKKCVQVILDTLKRSKKEVCEQLLEWMAQENTFNADLLHECCKVFIDKSNNQEVISLDALERLVKIYAERSWNQIIPVNDSIIASVVGILIKRVPNKNEVSEITEWMMSQNEFDFVTFVKWIRIFKDKETENSVGVPMLYPLRDKLIDYLKKNTLWVDTLASDPSYEDVAKN